MQQAAAQKHIGTRFMADPPRKAPTDDQVAVYVNNALPIEEKQRHSTALRDDASLMIELSAATIYKQLVKKQEKSVIAARTAMLRSRAS